MCCRTWPCCVVPIPMGWRSCSVPCPVPDFWGVWPLFDDEFSHGVAGNGLGAILGTLWGGDSRVPGDTRVPCFVAGWGWLVTATLCPWGPLGIPVTFWGSTPCWGCSRAEQPSGAEQEGSLFWGLFNFDDYFFCWGSSETREMITQDLSSSASLSHAWEVWREARGLRRRRKISSSRSNVSWIISPLLTGAAPCKRTGALLDR